MPSWSNRTKAVAYLVATIAYGIAFGETWKHYLKEHLINLPASINTIALGVGLFVPMLILASISVTYHKKSRQERTQAKNEQEGGG